MKFTLKRSPNFCCSYGQSPEQENAKSVFKGTKASDLELEKRVEQEPQLERQN